MTNNTAITDKAKKFSIRLVAVLIMFASLIFFFWLITHNISGGKQLGFDSAVFQFFESRRNEGLTSFMKALTFFGSRAFLLPAYTLIGAYYLFFKKNTRNTLSIAAVAFGGAGILSVFKNFFKRDRPTGHLVENITSFSYPSGHSFSAFTLWGILLYLFWTSNLKQSWKWIYSIAVFIGAVLIAISRIYLHVHFASDVLAGFCLSLVWLTVCFFLLKHLKLVNSTSKNETEKLAGKL